MWKYTLYTGEIRDILEISFDSDQNIQETVTFGNLLIHVERFRWPVTIYAYFLQENPLDCLENIIWKLKRYILYVVIRHSNNARL